MRTTKPRAIPTILRLIDWLNMVLGSWQLERRVRVRRYSARPTMNRMKPAFLIRCLAPKLLQSRRDSAAAGWRSALRSPPPFIVNGPACNSGRPMNSQAGSQRACSRDTVGCEWSQPSARATAFAANSPFPYAHRNDWSPPKGEVAGAENVRSLSTLSGPLRSPL